MSPLQFKHRNKFLILFFLLSFHTFPIFSQAEDNEPRTDNQFRDGVEVAVPIYKELYLTLSGDLRLGQVAENRFARGEAGFLYKQKIGKYFTVVPRYRYRAEQSFNGASETENRLSADGIVSFKIRKFAIADNNLFEFRFRRSGNSQRYRNRLKVSHPVTVGKTSIDLFASDEVYTNGKNAPGHAIVLKSVSARKLLNAPVTKFIICGKTTGSVVREIYTFSALSLKSKRKNCLENS